MNIERIPLSYRGKNIMAYRSGRGNDVVLLIHGSGIDHSLLSWNGVIDRLSKKARVYAVDLPGYGESDPLESIPEEGFYPYYHHCLEAVVDQLKLDRFVLVGLSMGGAIAIRYALEHPQQVCGLVPVSSWGLNEKVNLHGLSSWLIHRSNIIRKTCSKLVSSPAMLKLYVQNFLFGRKNTCSNELLDEMKALLEKDSVVDSIEFFQRSSLTPKGAIPYFGLELSKLKMPVLLIQGKRDPLMPRSGAEHASRIINNCRMHIMPSCRHWCCKEQPELFCQALWAFVKRDCLFSYKNMLPNLSQTPVQTVENPMATAESTENALHQNLKKRWEKRRRKATVKRLQATYVRKCRRK